MSAVITLLKQKWNPPANPTTRFDGQTILITGASTGLGLVAAQKFVSLGASKVIITARTLSKGDQAKSQIEAATGITGVVDVWPLEMGDYVSIRDLVKRLEREDVRLDVAILTAGLYNTVWEEGCGKYGWEEVLQVNALSSILLGILLVPLLMKRARAEGQDAGRARQRPVLEFVSSGNHSKAEFDSLKRHGEDVEEGILGAMNRKENFSEQKQYGRSKLVLQLGILGIADLVKKPEGVDIPVVVTSVCPGLTKSSLARKHLTAWWVKLLMHIISFLFIRTTEQGSRALVSGATLGPKSHGMFWQHDKLLESARQIPPEKRATLQKQVWFEILDALRKDVPEIVEDLQKVIDVRES